MTPGEMREEVALLRRFADHAVNSLAHDEPEHPLSWSERMLVRRIAVQLRILANKLEKRADG